jgi:ABC-type amino acid transport substrate-binding protein
MQAWKLLFVVSLVAVAFAGCAENGDGDTPTTPPTGTTPASPTPTTPGGGNATVDPTPTIDAITVGTDAAYPPFENTVGNEIVGFDVDVLVEVGNRSGFTVTFENALFDAIIPAVQNGQFDAGMSAFTITDERKQQVDFSVSYYDNELMAAVASDNTDIDAPEDLAGKTVCTQKGTTSETYLREEVGLTDENLLLFDTFPPCADAIATGEAVAMMIDRAVVRDFIERSEGDLKEAFVVPTDEQFGIAVAKGNTALLTAINAALVTMKQDGTLDALMEKWNV